MILRIANTILGIVFLLLVWSPLRKHCDAMNLSMGIAFSMAAEYVIHRTAVKAGYLFTWDEQVQLLIITGIIFLVVYFTGWFIDFCYRLR